MKVQTDASVTICPLILTPAQQVSHTSAETDVLQYQPNPIVGKCAAHLLNSHRILVQNFVADRDRQKGRRSRSERVRSQPNQAAFR